MPETIEISTKLIALVTAMIVLISTIVTLRKKRDSAQTTLPTAKNNKSVLNPLFEMALFFIGFMAFVFIMAFLPQILMTGGVILMKWLNSISNSIK